MSIEKQIADLWNESNALSVAYAQAAVKLPVITSNAVNHATTANTITIVPTGGSAINQSDPERVIVTFNTTSGANTTAKLEMTTDNTSLPIVRRLPYSGGAQWSVTALPKLDGTGTRVTTNYVFTVQSLIAGTLSSADATS